MIFLIFATDTQKYNKGSIKNDSSFPRFQFLFRNKLRTPNDCRVWRTSMHPRKKVQECVEKCTVMAVKSYLFRSWGLIRK